MLGINGGEFLLLIVVALVVVGPERLPRYAEQLGAWVRMARAYAVNAKARVTEELGEDVADVDWAALDPRRYDPRRIVREALLDDTPPPTTGLRGTAGSHAASRTAAAAGGAAGAAAAAGGAAAVGAGAAGRGAGVDRAASDDPDDGPATSPHGPGAATTAEPAVVRAPWDDEAT